MGKKNRKHSIIDKLPVEIKEAVDEMIKAGFTYQDIVDYIKNSGTEISIASVYRYAANLNETIQSLRMAQENFKAIMEETSRYPDVDITDGILRLLSNQLLEAINQKDEKEIRETNFETLVKNSVALTRAAAYKKNIDVKNKELLENGADQFKAMIFEAMAAERPDLYKEVKGFLKAKEGKLNR